MSRGITEIRPDWNDAYTEELKNWWDYNNGSSAFTGMLMAIIRIQDPSMWNVFAEKVLCQKKKEN